MRILILGDSISEGIGNRKLNYESELKKCLTKHYINEISILNLSKSGSTIQYTKEIMNQILEFSPEIVLIMYGSVEAQIRPNVKKDRFMLWSLLPKRYKIGGMLDPRAFYSKKLYRYIPDRLDNATRMMLKKIFVFTQGTCQWTDKETFKCHYEELIRKMTQNNLSLKSIHLMSTMYLDDKYFLNSSEKYIEYNTIIRELADKYSCSYVDLFKYFRLNVESSGWSQLYSNDHFHPSKIGYNTIARLVSSSILESVNENNKIVS